MVSLLWENALSFQPNNALQLQVLHISGQHPEEHEKYVRFSQSKYAADQETTVIFLCQDNSVATIV